MNNVRAITYSAVCAAISLASMAISRFLPLRVTPLMVCGMCFFIAFCSKFTYGFLCVATTLLLSFFMLGGINGTFLFTAFIFAPYSLLAYFLKSHDYQKIKGSLVRVAAVITSFNILLMTVALSFGGVLLEQVIFGFDISELLERLGSKGALYAISALICTAFMIGYDYLFVLATHTLDRRIRFKQKFNGNPADDSSDANEFKNPFDGDNA